MIEVCELYNGEVRVEFNPKSHKYTIVDRGETRVVPSVTTIVSILDKSGPLIGWAVRSTVDVCRGAVCPDTSYSKFFLEQVWENAKRAHRELKQEAADIGSLAHKELERIYRNPDTASQGVIQSEDERVVNCVHAAEDWLKEHKVEPVDTERRIYSRRYGYSGTLDKLARVDGRLSLIDWKSSKGLYPEYRLQTAAYVQAYEEEMGETVAFRYLVKLGKEDGEFEAHQFNRTQQRIDFRAFKAALELFRWNKKVSTN